MRTVQDDVIEFHLTFGHPIAEAPTNQLVPDRVRLRARLILEEAFETLRALLGPSEMARAMLTYCEEEARRTIDITIIEPANLAELADGFADLDYVVEGARLEFGINGAPIAREVHRSNMAKLGGEKRGDGKTLKPVGWTPPDIARELELQRKEPHAMGLRGVLWTLNDRAERKGDRDR